MKLLGGPLQGTPPVGRVGNLLLFDVFVRNEVRRYPTALMYLVDGPFCVWAFVTWIRARQRRTTPSPASTTGGPP